MTGASRALRSVASAAALLPCIDAWAGFRGADGFSQLGRPAWIGWLWLAAAGVTLARGTLPAAATRRDLAAALTLLLAAATVLSGAAFPALPGTTLALAGVALALAAPWCRPNRAAVAVAVALALALPACLTTRFPLGAVQWAAAVLPVSALVVLLPALFPGSLARRPAAVLVGATAVLGLGAMLDYVGWARALALPVGVLGRSRLHLMGLHPNLGVPAVATALTLACALVADRRHGRASRLAAGVGVALLALLLVGMGSRTGFLAAGAGAGVFALLRLPWPRLRRVVPACLAAAVLVALLVPATGLTDETITHRSSSMVSKAVSFRSSMWRLGRDTFGQAPWHGHGPLTTFTQAAHATAGRYDGLPKDDHPHNVALAVGNALGWPGLLGLALLLGVGLAWRAGASALGDAARVALAVHLMANGLDMGGALHTLYPAGVLVLLGLAQAVPSPPAERASSRGAALTAVGLALATVGLWITLGEHLLSAARGTPVDDTRLSWAEGLLPWDGRPAQLRADGLPPDQALPHLEQALALAPDQPRLVRAAGMVRLVLDRDDARAEELLTRSLVLDPYGPEAWRGHLALARLRGHQGRPDDAFEELLTAVLLNPAAVADLPWTAATRRLRLGLGAGVAEVPLDRLFAELGRRRADVAGIDPAYDARLRLREVELLLALGQLDEAEQAVRELLADEPVYRDIRLAQIAIQRGEPTVAADLYAAAGATLFEPQALRVATLASAEPFDGDGFDRAVADALALLPDMTFEAASLRRLTEARLTAARRRGDTDRERALARALERLDR